MATKAPATKAPAAKAAAPASKGGAINRKRRNSLERKCLPKHLKTLFAGSSRSQFKAVLSAWKDSRKKAPARESF